MKILIMEMAMVEVAIITTIMAIVVVAVAGVIGDCMNCGSMWASTLTFFLIKF